MDNNPFFSDLDNLNVLSKILKIDVDMLSQIAQHLPIGPLVVAEDEKLVFPKHWMTAFLHKRYPDLDPSLRQLTTMMHKWSLPICRDLMWYYRIQIYHHPLYVQFFPHRVPGLIRLVDAYLIAIHRALATSTQFRLTPKQTLVYVIKAATGWSNQAIAHHLFLSPETIKKHLSNIKAKQESLPAHEQQPVAIIAPAPFAIASWYIE